MSCRSGSTSTARERELYRYYQPAELHNPADDDPNAPKKSSSDPCLTAFAQLGALRLNAKRGLITLSTRDSEYILAESGQALSLQQDDDENDKLWHGVGQLKSKVGIGPAITALFSEKDAPSHILVGDLTQDERFKDKAGVVGPPHLRAMACVPLKSVLHGMVIGTYIVVDDKPHPAQLSDSECQFLTDMATTITDYLEANRLKTVQHRSERMVKAIGLFIEGKSTLRDWWLERGHKFQSSNVKKRARETTPLEHQADMEFGVQETIDYFSRNGLHALQNGNHRASIATSPGGSSTTPSIASGTDLSLPRGGDGRPALPTRDTFLSVSDSTTPPATFTSRSWAERNSSVTTLDTAVEPTPDLEKHASVSFDLPPEQDTTMAHPGNSHELQNALLSSDIKSVFARASNLIREAIGVEGVVYFDASVGSFGGSADKTVMEEKAPGAFHPDNAVATSEDDLGRQSSGTDGEKTGQNGPDAEKYCNVLGFSTRRRSSVHGHRVSDEHQKFPEAILRKLLKRYPHGKVFNFDDDGLASSSESDNTPSTTLDGAQPKPSLNPEVESRRRISREQEAAAILSVLPGARSVFWFPLWDQNRERWYSGSLVWSTCTTRTLCPVEDITYLAAFGNSTMAEISRLSAQVLSKMKTDFISSISHELRSPLHGVLASVEFLQETEMSEQQIDMVNNIHASGKVLLDTINHVLDFSKVNRKTKNKKRIPKRLRKNKERRESVDDGVEKADICVVSEEVIESIYAGQKISKKAFGKPGEHKRHLSNGDRDVPVTVIVDVAWRENWTFEIDKGAWRRILMNLFSNAMKYTGVGFVKVSLEIEDESAHKHHHTKKYPHSNLILRVKDSGRGISQEFLKHQLYKPFTQEDNLASGAGLGLSIVKAIIHDMGGKIEFSSEPGTGTEVMVRLPLVQSVVLKKVEERKVVQDVRDVCTGKKVGLVGFDRYPDLKEEPTGILDRDAEAAMLLKEAVKDSLKDWYDIDTVSEKADILVVMESGIGDKSLADVLETYGHGREKRVAIVLTSRYHSGPKMDVHEHFRIFYLQQPFGPHKLARILHQAFCRPEGEEKPGHSRTTSESAIAPATPAGNLSPSSETKDFANLSIKEAVKDGKEIKEIPHLWMPGSSPLPPPPPPSKHFSLPTGSFPLPIPLSAPAPVPPEQESITKPPAAHLHTLALPQTSNPAPEPETPKPGLRVLLVEDNEINMKLLIATMRKLKLEHKTAMNGLEALNAYKECRGEFDVIFMDISMPIMSGIESTRHIRRFERDHSLKPVALIALTGAANANTRQEAFSSGIDLFLTKPVPMKALRGMLEDLGREGRGVFAG